MMTLSNDAAWADGSSGASGRNGLVIVPDVSVVLPDEQGGRQEPVQHRWRQRGLRGDIAAVRHVFDGIWHMLRYERAFRIQLGLSGLFAVAAYFRGISPFEWVIAALVVRDVLSQEMTNTASETVCDRVEPDFDLKIKLTKDLSSGAVGIHVLFAIALAVVFLIWPHIP